MSTNSIAQFVTDNSIIGATGIASLAFLYKLWRMLQSDRKADDQDLAERLFRDEMREQIKELKTDKKNCEDEKTRLYNEINSFQKHLADLEAGFRICRLTHPAQCPFLLHQQQGDSHDLQT